MIIHRLLNTHCSKVRHLNNRRHSLLNIWFSKVLENVDPWSAEIPSLYEAEIELLHGDSVEYNEFVTQSFGFHSHSKMIVISIHQRNISVDTISSIGGAKNARICN